MKGIQGAALIAAIAFIAALPSPALSQSAIGQLEGITGQTIDRYSPSPASYPSRPPTYVKKITLPAAARSTVNQPSASSMASMNALATGFMVLGILDAMSSSNSAQIEAQRAMAEAERQRLLEEQRQQRLISAANLRSFWDGSDRELSESLDDVFSVPGQPRGTDFFGIPLNPVVMPSDPAVPQGAAEPVALQGQTGSVEVLGAGAEYVTLPSMGQLPDAFTVETSPLQDGIMKSGVDYARESAWDSLKDIARDIGKSILPANARNVELMAEHVEGMNELTNNVFEAIESQRLVGVLANGGPGDYQAIMRDLDGVLNQGAELGLGKNPFANTAFETGFKLLKGGTITTAEAKTIVASKWKGFLGEQLQDRLTDGWMD